MNIKEIIRDRKAAKVRKLKQKRADLKGRVKGVKAAKLHRIERKLAKAKQQLKQAELQITVNRDGVTPQIRKRGQGRDE